VPDDVGLSIAYGQRRRGPDRARVFIAQVNHFTPGGSLITSLDTASDDSRDY
jgi:hypothetical protein